MSTVFCGILPNEAYRSAHVRRIAEMMAAETQRRNPEVMASKLPENPDA
jgi:hypothetical protein